MRCPYCGCQEDKVLDSRPTEEGSAIRRRRECASCKKRYTTYEKIEGIPLSVIKSDKSRQPFDREKIILGISRACVKRPISMHQIDQIVEEIENQVASSMKKEISSKEIGDMVLEKLLEIDEIAYVRFASVYKAFDSVESFLKELEEINNREEE